MIEDLYSQSLVLLSRGEDRATTATNKKDRLGMQGHLTPLGFARFELPHGVDGPASLHRQFSQNSTRTDARRRQSVHL
jgi:hypothetical protein